MKSKKFWLGMLVMVLAFGMTVVGCEPEGGGGGGGGGGRTTDLIISTASYNNADTTYNGQFLLQLSDTATVSWKNGIPGSDVLSWLTIEPQYPQSITGYDDLQVTDVQISATQDIILYFTVSYSSTDTTGLTGAIVGTLTQATVSLRNDAATLSAIKAKTNGVEALRVDPRPAYNSANNLLKRR